MSKVTQMAVVESKQAIWEYNPTAAESIINGKLDMIAVIHTLAVKVSLNLSRSGLLYGLHGCILMSP